MEIPHANIDDPAIQQSHEPLAFISGSFKKSAEHWSKPEKEAYDIISSVMRLEYMLMRSEGFIFVHRA